MVAACTERMLAEQRPPSSCGTMPLLLLQEPSSRLQQLILLSLPSSVQKTSTASL